MNQSIKPMRWVNHPLLILLVSIAWGLAGCGRADTALPVAQISLTPTNSSDGIILSPTPTMHPLDATKQAIEDQEQASFETAQAEPTPATRLPRPTQKPTYVPQTGIERDCESVYMRHYRSSNCWRDWVGGRWTFVVAGSQRDDPNQSFLGMYTLEQLDSNPEMETYPPAAPVGPLTITSVNPPLVYLTSRDGVNLIFNIQTRQYESMTAPTPSPTAGALPTPSPLPFPASPILDAFNRADGALGPGWSANVDAGFYQISGAQVQVLNDAPLYWQAGQPFGTSQEAFLTLAAIDHQSREHDLLLKVQGDPVADWQQGAIEVVFNGERINGTTTLHVETFVPGQPEWTFYPPIAVPLVAGDQWGARVLASGVVQMFQNGHLVGSTTLNPTDQAFFNPRGGRIGVWFLNAPHARFDDFGGGTLAPYS